MVKTLDVLLVEDNANDAELLVRHIQNAGFAARWTRVDNEPAFVRALENPPELIISDYSMPQFSGPLALMIIQERGLDIPFIIVSGTIGEETAVEVIRNGATDYLLKDRLVRLGPAIERALLHARNNRERQASITALRSSEQRFRTTLEKLMEGCQIIARDWTYLYVNETAARHGRRTASELIGRNMLQIYPGIEKLPMFGVLEQCLRDGTPRQIENEFAHEDGSIATFQLLIQPVPEGLFVLSLDITERKRNEDEIRAQLQELQRWQNLTVGRENRSLALKAEVNELLAQAGKPPRYLRDEP